MPRAGLYALLAILGFALLFAFLPSGTAPGSQTGAQLSGVRFRLYPSSDPQAVWNFAARQVSSDPVAGETRLSGISGGERRLKVVDKTGRVTEKVDALLATPELTIDGDDNMVTRQARITLVAECADIDLRSRGDTPVKIEQGVGFSAPLTEIRSPLLSGHYEKLRMTFDFRILDVDNDHSTTSSDLDTTERCVNGKRVRGAGT